MTDSTMRTTRHKTNEVYTVRLFNTFMLTRRRLPSLRRHTFRIPESARKHIKDRQQPYPERLFTVFTRQKHRPGLRQSPFRHTGKAVQQHRKGFSATQ